MRNRRLGRTGLQISKIGFGALEIGRPWGLPVLDLLQIHCGPEEVETVRRGEVLRAMSRARQEGKVRWLGVSCHAPGAMAALEAGGYDVLQVPYSLLNRSVEDRVLARAAEADVGIIVREPLERGKLTEKSRTATDEADPTLHQAQKWLARIEARRINRPLSDIALQFVLRDPRVSTVLVGTRSIRHLEAAVKAADAHLDSALLAELTSP